MSISKIVQKYNVRRGGLGAYTGMNLCFAYMYARTRSESIGIGRVFAYMYLLGS